MATIINRSDILSIVKEIDLVDAMEKAFIKYSRGEAVVPPVGELVFTDPPGDTHIKYGYIKGDDYYCIKIASGFYNNPSRGLSSSQGMMLLFNQKTGEAVSVLLDDGELTNLRTAAAGALAAKYFAPETIDAIGIIGAGIQGSLQLEQLKNIVSCRKVFLWDINPQNAAKMQNRMDGIFDIHLLNSPSEVAQRSDLIITATPSESPLIGINDVKPGTHITALGSDTAGKQELSSELMEKADLVIADSIEQSKTRGEIYRARKAGYLGKKKITELGTAIEDKTLRRSNSKQISIVDLTGVAVQDIMIATAVYKGYMIKNKTI
jgi:ornithine cyclodeaminase